jgi:hypothetical protein
MATQDYPRWSKQLVAVSSSDWTPIVAPFSYDYLALRCDSSALVYRTDKDDPATEDQMPAAVQDGVTGANSGPHKDWSTSNRARFPKGIFACWVKSVQPSATLIVTWVL